MVDMLVMPPPSIELHLTHSLTISLLILYMGGWNHSDLEFIISLTDRLISTPSLICLLKLSLLDLVTLALNLLSSPGLNFSMCLLDHTSANDPAWTALQVLLQLLI